ncbi:MAG TPA: hypothetical protein VIG64_01640 [Actinomycetota bacterium]|jgi:hypothetical protein
MKKSIGLIALTAVVGAMLVPATSASAAKVGAGVGECRVTLAWPGSGGAGDCTGLAVGGVFLDHLCLPTCALAASVDSYSNICIGGLPPLIGEARGTLSLDGSHIGSYHWVRVGAIAVITVDPADPSAVETAGSSTVDTGAGVAAFLPLPPFGTCANPNPAMSVEIAGAVFAVQVP